MLLRCHDHNYVKLHIFLVSRVVGKLLLVNCYDTITDYILN